MRRLVPVLIAEALLISCSRAPVEAEVPAQPEEILEVEVQFDEPPFPERFEIRHTPQGLKYGFSYHGPTAPLALVYVSNLETPIVHVTEPGAAEYLLRAGFNVAAIELPCAEGGQLYCWRERIERGEDLGEEYAQRMSSVIDDIEARGLAHVHRVTIVGVSRGAFLAFRAAAADDRIQNVVAMAPVVNLLSLTEFAGVKASERTGLRHLTEKLTSKSIYIEIANRDDRVGTPHTLRFVETVATSVPAEIPVDLTTNITNRRDHREKGYPAAIQWAKDRLNGPVRPMI